MNNGQNNQPNGAYFTSGIGNLQANQNQETIPNLNINESAWSQEKDTRHRGGNVILSMEASRANQVPGQDSEMGKVVPLEPVKPPESISDAAMASINADVIRIDGERITKAAQSEINQAKNRLAQTHNASNFYRETRYGMVPANLDNSYNRKLAA